MGGKEMINSYISWLKDNMSFVNLGEYTEITTPFLDSNNDHLQIYATKKDGKIILSDDGEIISELLMRGCDLSTEHRKSILNNILNGFGVKNDNGELYVEADEFNAPQKKHMLLQAMMSVSDMFMLSRSNVTSVFVEDVKKYLDVNKVRYISDAKLAGKSGFSHNFDFVIPFSERKPERMIRSINEPSKGKIESVLFSWEDVREERKNNAILYVIINDTEKKAKSSLVGALENYGAKSVSWSERDLILPELAA